MNQSYSTRLSQPVIVHELDEQELELLAKILDLRAWPKAKPTVTSSTNRPRQVATFHAYRSGQGATYNACRPRPTVPSCAYKPLPTATSCVDSPQPTAMSHAYKHKYWVASLIALLSILLVSSYFSQNDKSLNWKDFPAPSTIASTDPLSTELGRHKTTQDAPNNLPHFPGPFVGRDNDIRNITSLLFHPHTQMVHIFGLPAVGKSTLAVHLGYKVVSCGVAVRYINMDDSHISKSSDIFETVQSVDNDRKTSKDLVVSKTFGNITLSWYSPSQKESVSATTQALLEWAKGLSNTTLLILDNCDLILKMNTDRENSFLRVLDALSKASPYLHTVTTSRLQLNLLDAKPYKLQPLDSEFAVELLQLFTPITTLNDSRMINELVDGIPLALKIVGSLVSTTRLPNLIIKELQQNLIHTLTPEDRRPETQKIRPVLKLSFNYLHSDTQECALYLSHFPGSFSQEAALHILNNCTNSTPIRCLRNLTDTSLLDHYYYAGQHRYQFHKLIKEFLIDVEFHDNQTLETSMIDVGFNSSFVSYYTELLHNFVTIYNQMPHDDENIGRFEYESHNFDGLVKKVSSFNAWRVKSVVHFTHALNCDLMLEIFTLNQLLKVGQKVLMMFEGGMDDISQQIGALETLNVYQDLVLVLREWIKSFPEKECKTLCEETFLQQGFASRGELISRQCAKTSCNRRDYFRELQFSYFGESVCFSYCLQFSKIDINMLIICSIVMLVITMLKVIIRRRLTIKQIVLLLVVVLSLYLCFMYFSLFVTTSLGIVIYISNDCAVLKRTNHNNFKKCFSVVYFSLFFVLMMFAFRENMIMTNTFFCFCVIVQSLKLLHNDYCSRKLVHVLYALSLLFLFHTYIYESEYLHYGSSCILAFMYPYMTYFRIFLKYKFVVTCMIVAAFDM